MVVVDSGEVPRGSILNTDTMELRDLPQNISPLYRTKYVFVNQQQIGSSGSRIEIHTTVDSNSKEKRVATFALDFDKNERILLIICCTVILRHVHSGMHRLDY